MVPNFIRISEVKSLSGGGTIDIKDFTDEELRQIGKDWTDALIRNAKQRRLQLS
ncbi:MAG: hypothetical protein K0S44_249 [Bacteroidetes bacterium]|nr:hypothetical protein [Bacteroidota bacterium]